MGMGLGMIDGCRNFHYGCVWGDCFEGNELGRGVVIGGTLKCNIAECRVLVGAVLMTRIRAERGGGQLGRLLVWARV